MFVHISVVSIHHILNYPKTMEPLNTPCLTTPYYYSNKNGLQLFVQWWLKSWTKSWRGSSFEFFSDYIVGEKVPGGTCALRLSRIYIYKYMYIYIFGLLSTVLILTRDCATYFYHCYIAYIAIIIIPHVNH